MRRLLLLALVGCGTDPAPAGGAQLVLDIPNGTLDPKGFTSVQITMHEATGDTVRSAAVANGAFDLGDLDPRTGVSIEAVLRDDSGASVGYGRTAGAIDLAAGATITVQVRRPIAYFAGLSYTGSRPNETWIGVPATYSDLSTGVPLDGSAIVGDKPVLMIAAGPELYAIGQAAGPLETLIGSATIRAISTGDHSQAAQISGVMTGAVQDGVGSDDGTTLVIGTAEKLFVVDTRPDAAAPVQGVAMGSFGRVAMITRADGSLGAVAIKNRVTTTGTCNPTAELWWIENTGGEVVDAKMIATGGFADVASDRGRAWYVDACKGELGEAVATGVRTVRTGLGKPTALAVSNGQAWIGIEKAAPTALALVVASVESSTGAPRTLWVENQEQVLAATDYPGVERRLFAMTAGFLDLEVGAGGDYIAAATTGYYEGAAVIDANFPSMKITTDELRVFDAVSGGNIQRYRSWCDGSYSVALGDIDSWKCAITTGQTAVQDPLRRHRIRAMTFQFGKK